MKTIKILAIALASMASVQAATVSLSAGFGANGIIVTTTSETGVTSNSAYNVQVGGFSGGIFTLFPVTSAAVNLAAGAKIAGAFSNNNTDAASLSGDAIFVRVNVGSWSAILSTPAGETFPDLTSGIASNGVNMYSSATVSVVQSSGTGLDSVSFAPNGNTLNFKATAVPEPTAALLGAIGALGLLRRRRI
jgi:hypothetical protein